MNLKLLGLAAIGLCAHIAVASPVDEYEQFRLQGLQPTAQCGNYKENLGISVTRRDDQGQATAGRIRVLVGAANSELYIIGAFNAWGAQKTAADQLHRVPNSPYYEGTVRTLTHGMEYRLVLDGAQVLDPAALRFTAAPAALNAVFWDFDRPEAYKPQAAIVDLTAKPVVIAEGEIYSLAKKWPTEQQVGPSGIGDTFHFVATSGLPEALYKQGYNAIEIMPLTQTNDDGAWQFRYQTYGLYAIDSRYGTPDDFAQMLDAFHRAGIAVVVDSVLGHVPFDGNVGRRSLSSIGIGSWKRPDGAAYFGPVASPWGTNRWDFANPDIRNFLTDSVNSLICRYPISGLRFDNVDGIRLYDGPGGGGPEFLQQLTRTIRAYRPQSLLIGEMFTQEPAVERRLDRWQGIGMGYINHGGLFEFFRNNLQRNTAELDMNWLAAALHSAWDSHQAPRIQYLTDHDEAGNVRGGATGSYVATLVGGQRYYQEHKTIAFASIALFSGNAYLDMPQMRLAQTGTFSTNNAVDWSLVAAEGSLNDYFTAAATFVRDEPAFALANSDGDFINHLDAAQGKRIISFKRHAKGRTVLIIVNLSQEAVDNYRFGVDAPGNYKLQLDSDDTAFGGSGLMRTRSNQGSLGADSSSFYDKPASLLLPHLGAYTAAVFTLN